MRLPRIDGEVERRLLVNYRVDPTVAARVLPAPFRPQLAGGHAVAGICLIRMGHLRPAGLPRWAGVTSENAAHRFAVEWDGPDGPASGVYIPRRDTSSRLNAAVGGRLFPGVHRLASFDVTESPTDLQVAFSSADGTASVTVEVRTSQTLHSEVFRDVTEASAFFERGADGFSATRTPGRYDGIRLDTSAWRVEPVEVLRAESSFFSDRAVFPAGTAELDSALLMRRVPVRWSALSPVTAGT